MGLHTWTDAPSPLAELEASAQADVVLPTDAHVIGEPVTVTPIHGREDAAAALRRLLRLDPADHLGAGARLAAIEAGTTWRELDRWTR